MFRTNPIAISSVLALSGFLATHATAQHLHGNAYHGFAPEHFHTYRYHVNGYHHHTNLDGHCPLVDTHYPSRALIRPPEIPTYTRHECPYGIDAIGSHQFSCPLQRGRDVANPPEDGYLPAFDTPSFNSNHSRSADIHHGHSHHGHAHEGDTHNRLTPQGSEPSDRGYLTPPSLPPGSLNDAPAPQRLPNGQPPPGNTIRMDGPPPSTISPGSSSPSNSNNSRQFDSPPPPTL